VPAGGSTATPKTLSYTTQPGDGDPSGAGSDNVSVRLRAVRTEDSEVTDLNSQTAEVLTPAFYEITDANIETVGGDTPSASTPDVEVGTSAANQGGNQIDQEDIKMNVTVQNTGETNGNDQDVDFDNNNRDSQIGTTPTFNLDSGQSNTKSFTYTPDTDGPDAFGFNDVTFETSGNGNTLSQADFYDIDSPEFEVTELTNADDIDADGGTTTITVTVKNNGSVTDDQEVVFRIPSDQTDGGSANGNNYIAGDQEFGTPDTSDIDPGNTDSLSADWTASCDDFDTTNTDSDNNAMDVEWDTEIGTTYRADNIFNVNAGIEKDEPCELNQ
jgi:hypothetical protein